MGKPPLEIVAYSSSPFFPFRLKQNTALAAEAVVLHQEVERPFAGPLRVFAGLHREGDKHQVVHKVIPFR
jgi:hypothetical protein